ncbi:MAG: hypothetical protein U1D30_26835 [Planctomycetota bacterium]
MNVAIQFVTGTENGRFVATLPDIPATGEGNTTADAIQDLKRSLRDYIDAIGLDEALTRLSALAEVRQLDWKLHDLA